MKRVIDKRRLDEAILRLSCIPRYSGTEAGVKGFAFPVSEVGVALSKEKAFLVSDCLRMWLVKHGSNIYFGDSH